MFHLRNLLLAVGIAALAASGVSCGDVEQGSSNDADSDTGSDTDSDTDTDVDSDTDADADCPGIVDEECTDDEGELIGALATAEELVVSRFVDVAFLAILAAQGSPAKDGGNDGVAIFYAEELMYGVPEWKPVELSPEAMGMQPVALAEGCFDDAPVALDWSALLCIDGDRTCSLWRAIPGESDDAAPVLVPLPNGDVPTDGELRGLTFFPEWTGAEEGALCAFGDGIFCFDGESWTTELAFGTGPLLNDLDCDRSSYGDCGAFVAVGDGGRVVRREEGSDEWVDGTADTSEDLRVVSDSGSVYGGTGGLLYGGAAGCAVSEAAVVGLAAEWYFLPPETPPDTPVDLDIAVVTENRRLFFTSFHLGDGGFAPLECGLLYAEGVDEAGGALAARHYFCGIIPNLFVLTESVLYGTWDCAID